jgi:hypothetical protein
LRKHNARHASSGPHLQAVEVSSALTRRGALLGGAALTAAGAGLVAFGAHAQPTNPGPLPSGRDLDQPASILPADVMARVKRLRREVDLVRRYMGRPTAAPHRIRIEEAQPRVVYAQAENLFRRANRLSFEVTRTSGPLPSAPATQQTTSADVFHLVDATLERILRVKEALAIDDKSSEQVQARATSPADVFHEMVAATADVNQLTRETTSPSDVYRIVTRGVHLAAAIQAAHPGAILPDEPPFEPNKVPSEVYQRLVDIFGLIERVAKVHELHVLDLQIKPESIKDASPLDVSELASVTTAELGFVHSHWPNVEQAQQAYFPGVRYPSHVYQRAGMLSAILTDILDRAGGETSSRDAGK